MTNSPRALNTYQYSILVEHVNGVVDWNSLTYSVQSPRGQSGTSGTGAISTPTNLSVVYKGAAQTYADSNHLGWKYGGNLWDLTGDTLILWSSTTLKGFDFQLNEDGMTSDYIDVPLN